MWLDRQAWIDEARAILERVRLADKRDVHASALPHGDQRKLEVAMLMALDPQVYMFDEPTAGMSVDEVPVVLDLIRALKARKDRLILLVEHKMDVVRELSDRIVVLHNGAAGGRWRAGRGDRIAGGAASLSRHGAPRSRHEHGAQSARTAAACTRTSARTTSCTASTSACARAR